MADGYRIAVVGATGAVGQKVLQVLEERDFPLSELVPFASPRSQGRGLPFRGRELVCRALTQQAVQQFDLAFMAAGSSVSREWAPRFGDGGALVIDKTSCWRMDPEVPLVVPEINPDAAADALLGRGIVSSPNCSTMALVMALHPLHREARVEEVIVSTYQSVSGTGNAAVQELEDQSHALLHRAQPPPPAVYPHQIAFNALPHVETFAGGEGYSTEERKMMDETRKILGLGEDELHIVATCVRVPVMVCHSESVRIRTREPLEVERARELLEQAEGVVLVDDPATNRYPTAIEAADRDEVFVGRLRHDPGQGGVRHLNMWVVADNLRKGAATNAVQIAQLLHEQGLAGAQQRAAWQPAVA
ncbi:MAG: aspartate-semialdehyde dehydrogenase [Solirubrobacterales bacterium]|nr:aspartate-semialdehyde dehydrogenase [Solirubrobacterales bacterium]MBV9536883.1 aspartate-semialdehyde dehydrogenase [Solirubrobacterales bacterium]